MNHLARARKVFDIEIAALKAVRAQLDTAFDRAVDLVMQTLQAASSYDLLARDRNLLTRDRTAPSSAMCDSSIGHGRDRYWPTCFQGRRTKRTERTLQRGWRPGVKPALC